MKIRGGTLCQLDVVCHHLEFGTQPLLEWQDGWLPLVTQMLLLVCVCSQAGSCVPCADCLHAVPAFRISGILDLGSGKIGRCN